MKTLHTQMVTVDEADKLLGGLKCLYLTKYEVIILWL